MGRAVHLTQHKRFQGPTRAGGLYNVLPQEMSSDHTVHDTLQTVGLPGLGRCVVQNSYTLRSLLCFVPYMPQVSLCCSNAHPSSGQNSTTGPPAVCCERFNSIGAQVSALVVVLEGKWSDVN